MEPPFLPGAGADPIWSEPESAPGLRTSRAGAAQKSGVSATLVQATHGFWLANRLIGDASECRGDEFPLLESDTSQSESCRQAGFTM